MPKEDPYKVLGIPRTDRNNMGAIKKAYRQKARDAHPDKNLDLDTQTANDNFHRIVNAWELLSNKQHKQRYDSQSNNNNINKNRNTGGWTNVQYTAQQRKQNKQRYEQQQQEIARQAQLIKDAKVAQDRVLKLSTIEQLQHYKILDNKGIFQKYFLCVFVADKRMERQVDDKDLFPYPFGPNGRNSFNWETILQTAKVRYNKVTPLTKAFRVPMSPTQPYIVFAKKGARLDRGEFEVYKPSRWSTPKKPFEHFEKWIMTQLTTTVDVVNLNHEGGPSIRVYLDDGDNNDGKLKSAGVAIPPGFKLGIAVTISDRVIILDGNMDEFVGGSGLFNAKKLDLGQNADDTLDTIAMDIVLVQEEKQTIDVGAGHGRTTRHCYDLSLRCRDWVTHDKCHTQVEFAHNMCAKSCGVCIESQYWNGLHYTLFHLPIHKVPDIPGLRKVMSAVQSAAKFVLVFWDDVSHLWQLRRNVAFVFFLTGLLFGIQIVVLARIVVVRGNKNSSSSSSRSNNVSSSSSSPVLLGLILLSTTILAGAGMWMSLAKRHQVPSMLQGFHNDLWHIRKISVDMIYGLFCLGFLSVSVSKMGTQRLHRRPELRLYNQAVFLLTSALLSTLMVVGTTLYLKHSGSSDIQKMYRYTRWDAIWALRKNVAISIIVFGNLFGASVMGVGEYAKQWWTQSIRARYLVLSVANVGLWFGLLHLALRDSFFLEDLEHVVNMRMSAAIPCIIVGMVWGLSGAHFFSNYQIIKLKVD